MADQAAHHHLTRDVEYGREDIKWYTGILVVETNKEVVAIGELREPTKKGNECRLCKQPGHKAKDCPNKEQMQSCRNCLQPGHHKSQCPTVVCSNCDQQGHLQASCPESLRCRRCKSVDHQAKDCPENPKSKKNRNSKACKSCGAEGHATVNCGNKQCTNCGELGHLIEDCMSGPDNSKSAATASSSVTATATASVAAKSSSSAAPTGFSRNGDQAAKEPADADGEETVQPPSGTLPEDDTSSESLSTRFSTNLSPLHISRIGFGFEGSFNSSSTRTGRDHKSASISFTHKNLCGALEIRQIEPADEAFTKHVPATQIELAQKELESDPDSSLYHIHIPVRTDGGENGYAEDEAERPLYGQAMYTDLDFGPFTETFRRARNMLTDQGIINLHFFTVAGSYLEGRLHEVCASMEEQDLQDPLLAWWPGGRINPQAGMQMPAADRPSDFQIHKRYQFIRMEEYFTIHFQNLAHELEGIEKKGHTQTIIRIASFEGGGDQLYFAHIIIPADTHFRAGSVLDVKLAGPDADDKDDWKFHLIEPMPFTLANEYAGYLFRPRIGQTFVAMPALEEGLHLVAAGPLQSSTEMREAMAGLAGIRCYVREHVPNVGVRRAINTINHLYLGRPAFKQEMRLLLTNNMLNLPSIDYFAKLSQLYGHAAVERELAYLQGSLGPEQQQVATALRSMKAGMLLIQGPGGVGKSEILISLAVIHYRLEAHRRNRDGRLASAIWVVSPINKQLDELAVKIFARCEEERKKLEADGIHAHPPIVIRRHMGSTEKRVYKKDADARRDHALRETKPSYWEGIADDEDEDEDEDDHAKCKGKGKALEEDEESKQRMREFAKSLVTERRLQMQYLGSNATAFDKRLQLEELSEGRWVLRRAGYPDPDGTTHSIAAPEKHAEFRRLLHRHASGEDLREDDMTQLTLLANQIVVELATMADAVAMTPDVVSQTRAHKLTPPTTVFHDEAGKAAEYGTLAAIVFSRPYNNASGPLRVSDDTHVPHVLFGDIYQPTPVLGHDASFHPFGQQNSVSLFQRWVLGGLNTIWLYEQHRSNSDIISLINFILPRGQMRVAHGIDDRPECALAASCATEIFKVSKRVIFMSIPGKTDTLPTSKSRYNNSFISPVWKIVFDLLAQGFAPAQIAIISAYTAQVAAHRFVQQALIEWCMQRPKDSFEYKIVSTLGQVECFTIDKMQGAQKEVVIHCTTNSGPLGFTLDTTRQLLANGRARSLLIIIGDPPAVQDAYTGPKRNLYLKSAYYKAVVWCKENKTYINLHHHRRQRDIWQVEGFPMDDTLADFYRAVTSDRPSISIDPAAEWDTDGEEEEGDNGSGGGANTVGWDVAGSSGGDNEWGGDGSGDEDGDGSGDEGLVDDAGDGSGGLMKA